MGKADRGQARLAEVRSGVGGVYGEDLHAKRIASRAGATLGVMQAASLAVAMIGQALARARGLISKHAISGPAAQQPWHRRVGEVCPLGPASDRGAPGGSGGDGLDRL